MSMLICEARDVGKVISFGTAETCNTKHGINRGILLMLVSDTVSVFGRFRISSITFQATNATCKYMTVRRILLQTLPRYAILSLDIKPHLIEESLYSYLHSFIHSKTKYREVWTRVALQRGVI